MTWHRIIRRVAFVAAVVGLAAVASPPASAQSTAAAIGVDPHYTGSSAISGIVTNADGVPVKGAVVNLFDADAGADTPIAAETTGADGRYLLSGVAAGEYRVRVIGDPFGGAYLEQWWRHAVSQPTATPLELVTDETEYVEPFRLVRVGGGHFSDVAAGTPFFYNIEWMNTRGLSTGFANGDGTFAYHPLESVSRQAMAAFLYRYINDTAFVTPTTATFSDVPTTHPFFREIEWMAANGISTGNADGSYAPNEPVSRQAMAAFLSRLSNLPTPNPASPSFTDVGHDNPFYGPIEWLASVGISTGYPDGGFHPTEPVTRQAMAAFLDRYDALH